MISLVFLAQRKIIKFLIEGKVVKYYDDNWKEEVDENGRVIGGGIQIMPSQTQEMRLMLRKMLVSRKPAIKVMGAMIVDANSGKNKKEYDECVTEEDIAEIVRKDCLTKGLVEVK